LSLSPLRATTITISIVGRAITLEREPSKKKQRTDTKKYAKRIKSDNFTRGNIGKMNDCIVPYLFHILVVAIIFSPTLYTTFANEQGRFQEEESLKCPPPPKFRNLAF
jgi:hypothetical protein